jgi:hypothetical protein
MRITECLVILVCINSNITIYEYHFNNDHINQDNLFIKLSKGGLSATTGAVGKKNPQEKIQHTNRHHKH